MGTEAEELIKNLREKLPTHLQKELKEKDKEVNKQEDKK